MSGSSLSDRLKSVESELNDITSLMSVKEGSSMSGSSRSDTSLSSVNNSMKMVNSKTSLRLSGNSRNDSLGIATTNLRQCCSSCSDTKLKAYSSSKSSSDSGSGGSNKRRKCDLPLRNNRRDCTRASSSVITRSTSRTPPPPAPPMSVLLQPSMCGDNSLPDYDAMQSYLHSINSTIMKGNQAVSVLSKISGISTDVDDSVNKPSSAPCSNYNSTPKRYKELLKELSEEKSKRVLTERNLDQLKGELKKYKVECKRNKDLYEKYLELNEQLEKENMKQLKQLKLLERSNEDTVVQVEMHKQKYEALLKDLNMEQEHGWEQEREMKEMKDCLDHTHLKIQELMGARTMAVELAHDLQKKHQTYVMEHQHQLQELKNKNVEIEKTLNDAISEKNKMMERLNSVEELSEVNRDLQRELDECKKNLHNAQRNIFDLTRNPEGIPQVRSMLDMQEQTFKAALTEKATSEMALQTKYTTLEVELQIILEEHSRRVTDLEEEKKKLLEEVKWKNEEHQTDMEKLKSVIQELTELSNQYKSRISELSDINKHQEVLIKCQNEAISSKEERVRLTNQEADLNMRRADQEKKALVMEHEKELAHVNRLLDEERDKVRVKEKMADDQAESIMHLKQNLSDRVKEVQRRMKELQQLEHSLKLEKQDKDNLMCDVQHLKLLRTRMREQINEQKKKIQMLSADSIHRKHSQMLEELEKKVARKQAEWDSELSKLKTERDQARETAQYAIENLSSAMAEYQREIANQKSLQTNLAALIKEKEEKLTAAENQIKKLEHDKAFMEMVPIGDRKRYLSPERTPVKLPVCNKHKELYNIYNYSDNLSLQNLPHS